MAFDGGHLVNTLIKTPWDIFVRWQHLSVDVPDVLKIIFGI